MSYRTGFYKGRLGIGLSSTMGMGDGNPRYPLDINGDIRLTGSIVNEKGKAIVGGGGSGATMAIRKQALEEEPSWTIDKIRSGDGNVGIGTTSPASILELSKSLSTEDDYSFMLNFKNTYAIHYDWSIGPYVNDNNAKFSIRGGADGFNNLTNFFTVVGNGNVGIGTTSPGQKLEVKTGTAFDGIILNNEDGGLLFKAARSNGKARAYFGLYNGSTSAPLGTVVFRNDDDSYINTGGKVGIGTTTPGYKLHIVNPNLNNSIQDLLCLETHVNSQTTIGPGLLFRERWNNGSYFNLARILGMEQPGYGGQLAFFTNEGTGTADNTLIERMRINELGNVGIGTESPQAKLIVKDNASDPCIRAEWAPVGDSSYPDGVFTQLNRYILECKGNNFHIDSHRHLYLRAFDNHNIYMYPYGGTAYLFSPTIDHTSSYRGDSGTKYCGTLVLGRDYYSPYLRGTRVVAGWSDHRHFEIWTSGGNSATHFAFRCGGYTSHGQCTASSFSPSSDNRLKQNEKKINNGLQIINKLNPVSYFKSQEFHEPDFDYELDNSGIPITDDTYHIELGFIAQDVKKIPELEHTVIGEETELQEEEIYKKDNSGNFILDENDNRILESKKMVNKKSQLHLNYNELFVCNIAATQELDKKVIALEKENAELKAELAKIKQHLGL